MAKQFTMPQQPKWRRKMRDLLDKLNEKAKRYPSDKEVENVVIDMVDFLGINGMFGEEDEGYIRATFFTDDEPKDALMAELDKRFPNGYEIVDMEEGATEVIFMYD